MKHQLYFPPRRAEQNLWLAQFREQFPAVAVRLEFTQEEIDSILRDLGWLLWVRRDLRAALEGGAKAATAYERALCGPQGGPAAAPPTVVLPVPPEIPPVPPGALKRIFQFIQRIKNRPGYDIPTGKMLGIEDNHYRSSSPVPTFRLRVERGEKGEVVIIKYSRQGRKAVYVETRRGGGDWEPLVLGPLTTSIHTDKRPLLNPGQPEVREYRMRFWHDSQPGGDWTDISSATVSP
ncbi:MAG TPA: hypothetical protein DDZ88_25080 [Verrucomicrobiales bacterium]|nr:hypothetical protein [Verrucomicrobiales bacterium]